MTLGGGAAVRVLTVVGTRPEIIRLSRTLPLLDAAFEHTLIHTGQNHDYELNEIFFEQLKLRSPDAYLAVDTSSLGAVLSETLREIEPVILNVRPHAFLVLGDTNSSIAAIMAKRLQIPVYHMEAGNRSFDPNVPEEVNRRMIDHVADYNLVYTEHARRNLLSEGLPASRVMLTGSPMKEVLTHYRDEIAASPVLTELGLQPDRYIVVSVHREENVDEPDRLAELLGTFDRLGTEFGREIVVSTHPRTRTRLEAVGCNNRAGISFHKPFGFLDYVQLERHAFCVVSDSGTVSEESSILGFPAVTIREAIERPEAIEAGAIVSTGVNAPSVVSAVKRAVVRSLAQSVRSIPLEYEITDFSERVVGIVMSTWHAHHQLSGTRRRSPVWRDLEEGPARSK